MTMIDPTSSLSSSPIGSAARPLGAPGPQDDGVPPAGAVDRRRRWQDADVLVALGALWVTSLVRVVGAFMRHEVFGAEATLAFVSLCVIPWIVFRAHPSRSVRETETPRPGRPRTPGDAASAPSARFLGASRAQSKAAHLRLVETRRAVDD